MSVIAIPKSSLRQVNVHRESASLNALQLVKVIEHPEPLHSSTPCRSEPYDRPSSSSPFERITHS